MLIDNPLNPLVPISMDFVLDLLFTNSKYLNLYFFYII